MRLSVASVTKQFPFHPTSKHIPIQTALQYKVHITCQMSFCPNTLMDISSTKLVDNKREYTTEFWNAKWPAVCPLCEMMDA